MSSGTRARPHAGAPDERADDDALAGERNGERGTGLRSPHGAVEFGAATDLPNASRASRQDGCPAATFGGCCDAVVVVVAPSSTCSAHWAMVCDPGSQFATLASSIFQRDCFTRWRASGVSLGVPRSSRRARQATRACTTALL
jgi:hypothetical protein